MRREPTARDAIGSVAVTTFVDEQRAVLSATGELRRQLAARARRRPHGYQLGTAPNSSFCTGVPCSRNLVTRGPLNGSRDFIQAFW